MPMARIHPPRTYAGNAAAYTTFRADHPTPSRVGGAPLTGSLGVDAYRGTAQTLEVNLVGRIDEYV
jgi:hypothetical protein